MIQQLSPATSHPTRRNAVQPPTAKGGAGRTAHQVQRSIFLAPPGNELWLKVRIDGKEGWLHSEEDFDALGLPDEQ